MFSGQSMDNESILVCGGGDGRITFFDISKNERISVQSGSTFESIKSIISFGDDRFAYSYGDKLIFRDFENFTFEYKCVNGEISNLKRNKKDNSKIFIGTNVGNLGLFCLKDIDTRFSQSSVLAPGDKLMGMFPNERQSNQLYFQSQNVVGLFDLEKEKTLYEIKPEQIFGRNVKISAMCQNNEQLFLSICSYSSENEDDNRSIFIFDERRSNKYRNRTFGLKKRESDPFDKYGNRVEVISSLLSPRDSTSSLFAVGSSLGSIGFFESRMNEIIRQDSIHQGRDRVDQMSWIKSSRNDSLEEDLLASSSIDAYVSDIGGQTISHFEDEEFISCFTFKDSCVEGEKSMNLIGHKLRSDNIVVTGKGGEEKKEKPQEEKNRNTKKKKKKKKKRKDVLVVKVSKLVFLKIWKIFVF